MIAFQYEAFSPNGSVIRGVIEAESLPNALSQLHHKGISPYKAAPSSMLTRESRRAGLSIGTSLGLEWRARTTHQLATLLAAGITLDRALQILLSQTKRRTEREFLAKVIDKVSGGQSLSAAISSVSDQFRADEVGLLKAGEQNGSLVFVTEELSSLLQRRLKLRGELTSALVYPAFLLALAPISLIIIATVLVPNIAPLFENSSATMPFALRAMIWASDEFRTHGLFWLLGFAGLCAIIIFNARRPSTQRLINKLPVLSTIKKHNEASRICRTLGSLLRSGAALQTALSAVSEVINDKNTQNRLRTVRDAVSGGEKLATALKLLPSLNSSALQMIAIGEETNKLEGMLLFVADTEEKALSAYINRRMALLTPVLTVVMGLFVGGIVMSIMRAILSVNELVAR